MDDLGFCAMCDEPAVEEIEPYGSYCAKHAVHVDLGWNPFDVTDPPESDHGGEGSPSGWEGDPIVWTEWTAPDETSST